MSRQLVEAAAKRAGIKVGECGACGGVGHIYGCSTCDNLDCDCQTSKMKKPCAMAGGVCQFPGCNAQATEGHHIVHRDNHALRWVAANVPGLCHEHHLWDQDASKKSVLLDGIIGRMGGQANYDALVLYGNTQPGEDPQDAIDRLQKVLDK